MVLGPTTGSGELSTTTAREQIKLRVPKFTVDTQILDNEGKSYLP